MLKKILKKAKPQFFYFLKDAFYTLNGWRFNDLKNYLKNSNDIHIKPTESLRLSVETMTINQGGYNPKFCYISVLPPELTGVSTCSYFTWFNYNKHLDFYTPVNSLRQFYLFTTKFKIDSNNNVRLFDVDSLVIGDEINNYQLVIIAVANSNHNNYVLEVLKDFINYRAINKICLHIHDPVLFNIVAFSCQYNLEKFKNLIINLYNDIQDNIIKNLDSIDSIIVYLVEHNKCGIMFFYKMGITKFIVNSQSAYEKINNELFSKDIIITLAFHPIFLPIYDSKRLSEHVMEIEEIRIGSFGVPTNEKMLDVLIESIKILNNDKQRYKLIIAGFHAASYLEQHTFLFENLNYELHDNPSDYELLILMNSVDLALQLRKHNLGESSGVVPQLLKLNKKIIVSNIGSFKDFKNCCYFYDNSSNPIDLANTINTAIEANIDLQEINSFVESRSSKSFQDIIENMISND